MCQIIIAISLQVYAWTVNNSLLELQSAIRAASLNITSITLSLAPALSS